MLVLFKTDICKFKGFRDYATKLMEGFIKNR